MIIKNKHHHCKFLDRVLYFFTICYLLSTHLPELFSSSLIFIISFFFPAIHFYIYYRRFHRLIQNQNSFRVDKYSLKVIEYWQRSFKAFQHHLRLEMLFELREARLRLTWICWVLIEDRYFDLGLCYIKFFYSFILFCTCTEMKINLNQKKNFWIK